MLKLITSWGLKTEGIGIPLTGAVEAMISVSYQRLIRGSQWDRSETTAEDDITVRHWSANNR